MCISSFVLVLILTLPGRVLSRREGAMAFASIISAGYVLFCHQKRTRKVPAISTRWIHEKGAARSFQTPKKLAAHKKAEDSRLFGVKIF